MTIRRFEPRSLGAIAALAIAIVGCSSAPVATSTLTAVPTSPATASASPLATTSASAAPIADGTYVSTTDVAAIKATITAYTKLTAAERADMLASFSGHTTQLVRLEFHGGEFTQAQAFDDAAFEVGVRATYAFPDDHTLVVQEPQFGITTFDIMSSGHSFSLRRTSAPDVGLYGGSKEDPLIAQILFESSPFTLVP
jgi:hypothetical protein